MIKRLLEWEYHFRYANFAEKAKPEVIYKISASSLTGLISTLYIFPAFAIIISLFMYKFDIRINVNKWLGALPIATLIMVFYFFLHKKLASPVYRNDIISSEFNQSLVTKIKIFRFVGFIFFIFGMVFSIYLLRLIKH